MIGLSRDCGRRFRRTGNAAWRHPYALYRPPPLPPTRLHRKGMGRNGALRILAAVLSMDDPAPGTNRYPKCSGPCITRIPGPPIPQSFAARYSRRRRRRRRHHRRPSCSSWKTSSTCPSSTKTPSCPCPSCRRRPSERGVVGRQGEVSEGAGQGRVRGQLHTMQARARTVKHRRGLVMLMHL